MDGETRAAMPKVRECFKSSHSAHAFFAETFHSVHGALYKAWGHVDQRSYLSSHDTDVRVGACSCPLLARVTQRCGTRGQRPLCTFCPRCLFRVVFDVIALELDELIKAKATQCLTLARLFPAGPRKIGARVIASVHEYSSSLDVICK